MPQPNRDLDDLIETLTIDCYGDDEELGAFLQAFEDERGSSRRGVGGRGGRR